MSEYPDIRRPRTCPKCHGAKRDFRFGEPCERCNGTGRVFDEQSGDDDLYAKTMSLREYEAMQAELAALRQQVDTLRAVLAWYANATERERINDDGERARQALEAAKESGNNDKNA